MALRALTALTLALVAVASMADENDDAARTARTLLAKRMGENPARIIVERVDAAEWPDASLGCGPPIPGATQSVRGHRVLLRTGGRIYAVHVAGPDAKLCAPGLWVTPGVSESSSMKQKPQPEPKDPPSKALVAKARADLQRRLSVEADEIEFLEFKAVVWPDGSLGCPRPDRVYPQVQRDGFLIRFAAQGRTFNYHGGSGRDPFLCEKPQG